MMKPTLHIVLFFLCWQSLAAAETLFEQPANSSGTTILSSRREPDGSDWDGIVWDNFSLATAQEIAGVRWRGGLDPLRFGSGGPVMGFIVSIHASIPSGLEPDVVSSGAKLRSYKIVGDTAPMPAGIIGGTALYDYSFAFPTPFAAVAGTVYWLQVQALQGGAVPDWGLARATGGDGRHFAKRFTGSMNNYQMFVGDAAFALLAVAGPNPEDTPAARLVNLSVRAGSAPDEQTLIAGFTLTGSAGKRLLVRCVGPTLSAFGVSGALDDPVLRLVPGAATGPAAENDDWGGGAVLGNAFTAVGAFPLGEKDAALAADLGAGGYTALADAKGGAGVVLLELYDLDPAPGSSRLQNLSARGVSGPDSPLIAGFTLRGEYSQTLLVRGLGPALKPLGVRSALSNPELTLHTAVGAVIVRNDDWANQPEADRIRLAAVAAGAMPLTAATRDAALLVRLGPGSYTAQLSGVGGESGIGLIEVYEIP